MNNTLGILAIALLVSSCATKPPEISAIHYLSNPPELGVPIRYQRYLEVYYRDHDVRIMLVDEYVMPATVYTTETAFREFFITSGNQHNHAYLRSGCGHNPYRFSTDGGDYYLRIETKDHSVEDNYLILDKTTEPAIWSLPSKLGGSF